MSMATVLEDVGLPAALVSALESLASTEAESAWRLSDGQVLEGLSAVGRLRQAMEVAEVALVREGLGRGLPGQASRTTNDWVALAEGEQSPRPDARHVAQVARVAKGAGNHALVDCRDQLEGNAEGDESCPGAGPGEVVAAFEEGDLPLGKADQLIRFEAHLRPVADAEMLTAQLGLLLRGARDEAVPGRAGGRVHGITDKELAVAITRTGRLIKPAAELDQDDRRARAGRALFKGPGPAGLSTYKLTLDAEGAAQVDAAVAALAEPVTGPDDQPDERSPARRRADALLEVIRRGVSSPGDEPKTDKAQVMVTIPWATLQGDTAHGGGVSHTGEVLSPGTVRRMACTAGIIPVVLGGNSEILDLGRKVRWFTPGQRRAIWLRDQGCTYPGCTMPGHWCDAHHVDWWSHGGTTDVTNGALLCGRHHTRVHDNNLTATITTSSVTWHL